MYTMQPKKVNILNILEILNKYTDSEHTLSQTQIAEKIEIGRASCRERV